MQEKTELERETTLKYQSPLLLYMHFCKHRTCAHLTNKIPSENATTVNSQHWKQTQLTHSIILTSVQTTPTNAYMLKLHRRYSPSNAWSHWGQILVQEALNKLILIRFTYWAWKLHSPCLLFPPPVFKCLIIGLICSIFFFFWCAVCITQNK